MLVPTFVVPSQVAVLPTANEQRKKVTVPLGVFVALLPVTVAMSWTGSPGTVAVFDGAVVRFAVQLPKFPSTKSFSVAVGEVEERVSERKLAKHSLAIAADSCPRLRPPSKNAPFRKVLLPLLSVNGHGEIVPFAAFTMPQKLSTAAAPHVRFVPPPSDWSVPFVSPPEPTHSKTLIVDVPPPLLKSDRMRMSPTLWNSGALSLVKVPLAVSSPIRFWSSQKPSWASPLLSSRSEPK